MQIYFYKFKEESVDHEQLLTHIVSTAVPNVDNGIQIEDVDYLVLGVVYVVSKNFMEYEKVKVFLEELK